MKTTQQQITEKLENLPESKLKLIMLFIESLEAEQIWSRNKLAPWEKTLLDQRLKDYYEYPNELDDIDKTFDDIEFKPF